MTTKTKITLQTPQAACGVTKMLAFLEKMPHPFTNIQHYPKSGQNISSMKEMLGNRLKLYNLKMPTCNKTTCFPNDLVQLNQR